MNQLADLIHDNQCTRPRPCGYEHANSNSHYLYYQDRARSIHEKLAPEIGDANVPFVVKTILDELW